MNKTLYFAQTQEGRVCLRGPESGKHRRQRSRTKWFPSDKLSLENAARSVKILTISIFLGNVLSKFLTLERHRAPTPLNFWPLKVGYAIGL